MHCCCWACLMPLCRIPSAFIWKLFGTLLTEADIEFRFYLRIAKTWPVFFLLKHETTYLHLCLKSSDTWLMQATRTTILWKRRTWLSTLFTICIEMWNPLWPRSEMIFWRSICFAGNDCKAISHGTCFCRFKASRGWCLVYSTKM